MCLLSVFYDSLSHVSFNQIYGPYVVNSKVYLFIYFNAPLKHIFINGYLGSRRAFTQAGHDVHKHQM